MPRVDEDALAQEEQEQGLQQVGVLGGRIADAPDGPVDEPEREQIEPSPQALSGMPSAAALAGTSRRIRSPCAFIVW